MLASIQPMPAWVRESRGPAVGRMGEIGFASIHPVPWIGAGWMERSDIHPAPPYV
ncbi:MAG: hypothetical protein JJU06_10245 [Ectothiorhodospiraceae bacterium]|nr:hypothetical protein [Ectothiorhodospiraceae bacterium]MCH8503067.1 hypothetical protein [Ectothiorhodospiraceae bacterium]